VYIVAVFGCSSIAVGFGAEPLPLPAAAAASIAVVPKLGERTKRHIYFRAGNTTV